MQDDWCISTCKPMYASKFVDKLVFECNCYKYNVLKELIGLRDRCNVDCLLSVSLRAEYDPKLMVVFQKDVEYIDHKTDC